VKPPQLEWSPIKVTMVVAWVLVELIAAGAWLLTDDPGIGFGRLLVGVGIAVALPVAVVCGGVAWLVENIE
jgi:hypothetical protein